MRLLFFLAVDTFFVQNHSLSVIMHVLPFRTSFTPSFVPGVVTCPISAMYTPLQKPTVHWRVDHNGLQRHSQMSPLIPMLPCINIDYSIITLILES